MPGMRRIPLLLVAALVLGLGLAQPATADPPPDAADLAGDCNADGLLAVVGNVRYQGGSGTLTADCVVTMAPRASLTLRDLDLDSGCCFFIIGDAQESTNVDVTGSTIDLAGPVQLSPGCCAGSGEPGRSEVGGTATVTDSTIRGSTVEVSGSIADDDGRVTVRDSTLEATDPTFGSVAVLASVAGSGGRAEVRGGVFIATSETRIASGDAGRTRVQGTTFGGPATVVITTGPGGTCSSTGTTPPTPCS
jgi:hypothetical protein